MNGDKDAIDRLLIWFTNHGGVLQDGVGVSFTMADGYHLKALDHHYLDSSKAIVHVPQALTFSISTISLAQSHWPTEFLNHYKKQPYIITRFLLMDEYLHGSSSWWYPYIALLPQSAPGTTPVNTPLWFSDEDLEWLHGTRLYTATAQRSDTWQKEYEQGLTHLTCLPRYNDYSWLLYKWASTIISSRCFPNQAIEKQANAKIESYMPLDQSIQPESQGCSPQVDFQKPSSNYPVLVPVLDLANHDPKNKVLWIINDIGYSLYTDLERVANDGQIYNNYGQKGNEELLMGYGFTIPNNSADSIGMRFPISTTSPQRTCASRILQSGLELPLHISSSQLVDDIDVNVSKPEFGTTSDDFYLQNEREIPAALWDTLRLSCANEREMKSFALCQDGISKRLSIQCHGQLVLALIQRYNTIQDGPALSGALPSNKCQKMAMEYVLGQSRILTFHIKTLLDNLNDAQKSSSRSNSSIWGLHDILQRGPSQLRLAIRGLSRAVCKTNDPIKLQRKGLDDSILAIVICLVMLMKATDSSGSHQPRGEEVEDESIETVQEDEPKGLVDEESGEEIDDEIDKAEVEANSQFEQWRRFLQLAYCPPPNTKGDCKGINCFCTPRATHIWSFPRTDWNSEVDVAYGLVQRYFLMSDPEPLFGCNTDLWTKSFLHWAFGILEAEAVLSPSLHDHRGGMNVAVDHFIPQSRGIIDFQRTRSLYLEREFRNMISLKV